MENRSESLKGRNDKNYEDEIFNINTHSDRIEKN